MTDASLVRSESVPPRRSITKPKNRRRSSSTIARSIEVLERREVMSVYTVTSLASFGQGSLRSAILSANRHPGLDTIDFRISGTIAIGKEALPIITSPLTIDGTSAPGFNGVPVVTIDFHNTRGFVIGGGAPGSTIASLSIVHAGGAGITLEARHSTIEGNYIGLRADGETVAGNRGDGVAILSSSKNNIIGNSNPVSSINYFSPTTVGGEPLTAWQGVRASDVAGVYMMTGTSVTPTGAENGLLFIGGISGAAGTSYLVDYPGATGTSVYGPDNVGNGIVRLVGSYNNGDGSVHGFVYQGSTSASDLASTGNYTTVNYPGATFTYVHSTMGGLAVGNADGPTNGAPLGPGTAFIYDVATNAFVSTVNVPGSTSNTAYGIWYNGNNDYTIVGGYSTVSANNAANQNTPIGQAYMVDYNSASNTFSHWATFNYPLGPGGVNFLTHFEGVSSDQSGVYTLAADSLQVGSTSPAQGSLVTVRRNPDGTFGPAAWVNLNYPGTIGITSANSVAGDDVVGQVIEPGGFAFQAVVNVGFQLSNVISGNGGNGIGVYGSVGNQIAMNEIGTDASGTQKRSNGQNGILLTQGAKLNMIGGQATGGNDPTAAVFVRPPQGNLISGNRGNGVLITSGARMNTLSGNFVGTSAGGNTALGNRLDGVAIDKANDNQLIGCTFQQSPFVFYNVISGNGGNGLRITDSNNVTVQANFIGADANNASVVANGKDGLLDNGTSANTQVGGVIPLGNVISGNTQNGIELRDQVRGFVGFNTFTGVFAFSGTAPNGGDGTLITSTGGNNEIRTSIVSGNRGNGIELAGGATGVQIVDTAVGTNTEIQYAMPNQKNGIVIDGRAHNNAIGGFKPSIEPQTTVSGNQFFGIVITGKAHNNRIYNTVVGGNASAKNPIPNNLGGIVMRQGASANVVGGIAGPLGDSIVYNGGNGITIAGSENNRVEGNQVSSNSVSGIAVVASKRTRIGGYASGAAGPAGGVASGAGNTISDNGAYGVIAAGDLAGSLVAKNVIIRNTKGNVNLENARGVRYIP